MRSWLIFVSCCSLSAGCFLPRTGSSDEAFNEGGGGTAAPMGGADAAGGAGTSSGGGPSAGGAGPGGANQGGAGPGGPGAGGAGTGGQGNGSGGNPPTAITWHSWDVTMDATGARVAADGVVVSLLLYQSASLNNLTLASGFGQFHQNAHPESFNHVVTYWATSSNPNTYPYAGMSSVGRGSDSGETNAQPHIGVFDVQLHPPNVDQLTVLAFTAPLAGDYTIADVAARRVDADGSTATLNVYAPCSAPAIDSLQASDDRAWVVAPSAYDIGALPAGAVICFGVDRDGDYGWDAVEISWSISVQP